MNIGKYNFSEPRKISVASSIDKATVYVVLTHDNANWFALYVGQTGDLAERFNIHEKWDLWIRYKKIGGLYFSYLPVSNKKVRINLETELRNTLPGLPCNKQ